jgi:hypothetical protein
VNSEMWGATTSFYGTYSAICRHVFKLARIAIA